MRSTVTVIGLLLASVAPAAPGLAAPKPAQGTPALTILLPDRDHGRAAVVYAPGQEKRDGRLPPGQQPPCPDGRGHSCEAPGHRKVVSPS
jgi:hypothetical protein